MGEFDHALIDIEKTLTLDPDNPEYIASKGAALIGQNLPIEGIGYLNKALLMSKIGFAYRYRALGNMAIGNIDEYQIFQDIQHAIELSGNLNDYIALARYYIEYGYYNNAFDALQNALELHRHFGKTYFWLGYYYEQIGDQQKSSESYKLAKQYDYYGNGY